MSTETSLKFTLNFPAPGGGQIQAAVWENEQIKGDESFTSVSITISCRYFDNDEQKWRTAKFFRENDLLIIAFATQEVYRRLAEAKKA